MKTFTADFNTEKNKKTGASPVWIMKCPFPSTGTIYLSDNVFSIPSWNGGITTKSWVKSWGTVDEDISGSLSATKVSDFSMNLIIDPNVSPNIDTILWTAANKIEVTTCELYLWFIGLNPVTNSPVLMWAGNIIDFEKTSELACNVRMVDESVKTDKYVGEIINPTDYPDADIDGYGRIANVLYGSCYNVPCRAIVSGDVDSIVDDITMAQDTIELSDATYFPSSGVVGIDDEQISYSSKSGNILTGCSRGYNSTSATTHSAGSPCWEELGVFVYLVAGHPVKEIKDVYVDGVRITSTVTKYTGQSGDELPGWPGKAVFTVPYRLTHQQVVDLVLIDNIGIVDSIGVLDSIAVNDAITISDAIALLDTVNVSDGIAVSDTIAVVDGIGVYDGANVSDTIGVNDGIGVTNNISYTGTSTGDAVEERLCSGGPLYANEVGSYGYLSSPAMPVGGTLSKALEVDHLITISSLPSSGSSSFYLIHGPGGTSTLLGTISPSGWVPVVSTHQIIACTNSDDWTSSFTVSIFRTGTASGGSYQLTINTVTLKQTKTPTVNLVKAGTVTKTGSASKSGTVVKTGATYKTGSASKSGTAFKVGTVTKTGTTSRSGTVSRSGGVTKGGAASKAGTVTRSGGVSLSGNSMADVQVGYLVTCNVDGYKDDASGTYTGVANALIERPDHIFKHFLYVYGGCAIANFITNTAVPFAADAYSFSVVINERRRLKEWCSTMAFQCRCYFRFANGKTYLIYRPDSLVSVKSITSNMIRMNQDYTSSIKGPWKTPLEEVINKIDLYYLRYWPEDGMYQSMAYTSDNDSIEAYGEKELPDLFLFDFVRSATMADDLRDFYLARYKDRKKLASMEVFLDNSELEFADPVTIVPLSSLLSEVQKVNIYPGSGKDNRNDRIVLTIREY